MSALTPEREQQLRELAEMNGPDSAIAHAIDEIDRLRAELAVRPTRAVVLREAADVVVEEYDNPWNQAAKKLRRMAERGESS